MKSIKLTVVLLVIFLIGVPTLALANPLDALITATERALGREVQCMDNITAVTHRRATFQDYLDVCAPVIHTMARFEKLFGSGEIPPVRIYVYDSREEAHTRNQAFSDRPGVLGYYDNNGRIFIFKSRKFESVLMHEFTHHLAETRFKGVISREMHDLTGWLAEGLAEFVSADGETFMRALLSTGIKLKDVVYSSYRASSVDSIYVGGYMVIMWMYQKRPDLLVELLLAKMDTSGDHLGKWAAACELIMESEDEFNTFWEATRGRL